MTHDHHRLQERLNTVCMMLWGVDGRNGLNSKVHDHNRRLTSVETRLTEYDKAQLQIKAVWATVRWIALGVAAAIGFLSSAPVASFIANIWRAGAG